MQLLIAAETQAKVPMEDNQPATKQDLRDLEERLVTTTRKDLGELEERLLDTTRKETAQLEERLLDRMRDMQTEVLRAFYDWARPVEIKLRAILPIEERLGLLEERISRLERGEKQH